MRTQTAIEYFGSQAEMARRLRITAGAVTQWGPVVPFLRACQIEHVSLGRCPVDDSLYDDELRPVASEAA
jgi:hypothetical protein